MPIIKRDDGLDNYGPSWLRYRNVILDDRDTKIEVSYQEFQKILLAGRTSLGRDVRLTFIRKDSTAVSAKHMHSWGLGTKMGRAKISNIGLVSQEEPRPWPNVSIRQQILLMFQKPR